MSGVPKCMVVWPAGSRTRLEFFRASHPLKLWRSSWGVISNMYRQGIFSFCPCFCLMQWQNAVHAISFVCWCEMHVAIIVATQQKALVWERRVHHSLQREPSIQRWEVRTKVHWHKVLVWLQEKPARRNVFRHMQTCLGWCEHCPGVRGGFRLSTPLLDPIWHVITDPIYPYPYRVVINTLVAE